MAAIIAQMTRANRERKKNKCFEIVIGKCMYEIGPFPEKYEPEVSNFTIYLFYHNGVQIVIEDRYGLLYILILGISTKIFS